MKKGSKDGVVETNDQPRMFIEKPIIPGFVFGVLRRNYSNRTNDAVNFVRSKLHPVAPPVGMVSNTRRWEPTAHSYDVLLPATVPDALSDPRVLVEHFEDSATRTQKDLVVMIKLTAPLDTTLHAFREAVRAFSRAEFVEKRSLATVLAFHVPGFSGAKVPARPHIHVMVLARSISASGFLGYCDIATSEAQPILVEAWQHFS